MSLLHSFVRSFIQQIYSEHLLPTVCQALFLGIEDTSVDKMDKKSSWNDILVGETDKINK